MFFPAGFYLLQDNNGNIRTMCKICSKLLKRTPKWSSWRCATVFIANSDQNLHIVLVYQLLTLSTWIQARVVLDREESFIDEKLSSYLCSCRKGHISLWCLVSTKRSHILKQTCSFQLQVYLSMYELLVDRKC